MRSAVNNFLRHNVSVMNIKLEKPLFNGKKTIDVKTLRKELIKQNPDVPCCKGFWKQKFNIDINEHYWLVASYATKEVRLRLLQWKILHNIYPTNILLHKMKVSESNKCSYCIHEVDYIEHFFYLCPEVGSLWKRVEQWVLMWTGIHIKLNITYVLFGVQEDIDKKNVINKIILIGKMSISIYKKTKSPPPLLDIFDRQLAIRVSI